MGTKKRITIDDLAKESGVPRSTVGRALKNHNVSMEAKRAVEAAISKLGYKRKQPKLDFQVNLNSVGILTSEFVDSPGNYYAEVITHLNTVANKIGIQTKIIDLKRRYTQSRLLKDLNSVNAVIIVGQYDKALLDLIKKEKTPCVLINAIDESMTFSSVCPDYELGGLLAGNYLVQQGHKRIKMIFAETRLSFTHRARGFERAMKQNGIEDFELIDIFKYGKDSVDTNLRRSCNGKSWDIDFNASLIVPHMIDHGVFENITAVFCGCDAMAFSLIHALEDRGISVPNEISVLGFDNVPHAEHFYPPLTTIDCQFSQLMRCGMHQLVHEAADPTTESKRISLRMQLMERNTVIPNKSIEADDKSDVTLGDFANRNYL
ncbi:LacI family transcriptional regulator [Vibrio inusitatus NBRC 102082]|uniref:LacI family transcriptional regulator n=1 Tax=Vibrio inusitatus NBRC 102082 TaxID=1219070 RepID=A0A4Y3HSI7_9VIBR|nr:LacI family DNA-binding transcriptional regulator [Vibrio inusitatus]GEA49901.1 LacI family transcriptional regulator [Vibrio inusitatus NBRC 102082]